MFAYNKAIIALLTPVMMGVFLKIDANILAPHNWGMGQDFWTAVSALISGMLVYAVPNAQPKGA